MASASCNRDEERRSASTEGSSECPGASDSVHALRWKAGVQLATDPFTPRASHVFSPRLAGRSLAMGARRKVAGLATPLRPHIPPV